jgi:hypothetical protein
MTQKLKPHNLLINPEAPNGEGREDKITYKLNEKITYTGLST